MIYILGSNPHSLSFYEVGTSTSLTVYFFIWLGVLKFKSLAKFLAVLD